MSRGKAGGSARVGVVGLGNFAQAQHIPNLTRMEAVSLVALCDINTEVVDRLASKYGVSRRFDDYHTMLDEGDIDSVVITVRDTLQADMAIAALERGMNVYVEKPLSLDPDTCRKVADAAGRSHGRLAVGYNKRFAPMYADIRRITRENGPPRMIHLAMTDDAWRWARGYEPGYLLVLDVCHHFDLIEWITESRIETVTARSGGDENYALLLSTASGCAATIMFSGSDSMDAPKEYARIICDRYSLTGEDYVELFVHGLQSEPESHRYYAHLQDGTPFLHRRLTKRQGISGWRHIRRIAWELRIEAAEAGSAAGQLERPFIPNFIRDQGWFDSLHSFLTNRDLEIEHASAEDAARIAAVTAAALRSRKSGTVERPA